MSLDGFFTQIQNLSFSISNFSYFLFFIRDIKKEPEDSECKIIEVVDLTKQVQKDAGQTLVELKAHVSLKFTICWLHLSVKFKILLVNLICEISKVKNLFSLKIYMYISVCLSVCHIQRHFVICRIWQPRLISLEKT